MHCAMALETGLPGKGRRTDPHIEMALSPFAIPGMPAMAFAVINNVKRAWVKRVLQARSDFFGHCHICILRIFFAAPSSIWRELL